MSIGLGDAPDAPSIADIEACALDRLAPELSLDGRHLAVVTHDAPKATWTIYDTLDGRTVAHVQDRASFRSFRIFGRRLLYLSETLTSRADMTIEKCNTLIAADIGDGRVLWTYRLAPVLLPNRMFLPP